MDDLWVVETPREPVAHSRGIIEHVLEGLRIDDLQRQVIRVAEGVLQDYPLVLCPWGDRAEAKEGRVLDMGGEDAIAIAFCLVVVRLKKVLPTIEIRERKVDGFGVIAGAADPGSQQRLIDEALPNRAKRVFEA